MNANQRLLMEIGVSTATLERMVEAAVSHGALGAKLTGAGLGGAIIALAPARCSLATALREAGALQVMRTSFGAANRGRAGE